MTKDTQDIYKKLLLPDLPTYSMLTNKDVDRYHKKLADEDHDRTYYDERAHRLRDIEYDPDVTKQLQKDYKLSKTVAERLAKEGNHESFIDDVLDYKFYHAVLDKVGDKRLTDILLKYANGELGKHFMTKRWLHYGTLLVLIPLYSWCFFGALSDITRGTSVLEAPLWQDLVLIMASPFLFVFVKRENQDFRKFYTYRKTHNIEL